MDILNKEQSKISSTAEKKYISLISEFKAQLIRSSQIEKIGHNTISVSTKEVYSSIRNIDAPINHHPNHLQINKIKTSHENIIQAFIKTISKYIGEDDKEKTLQGLNFKIKEASEYLFSSIAQNHVISEGRSTITLKAVSEIIIHMINKHISRNLSFDFSFIKTSIVKLCEDLILICEGSKMKISKFFKNAMRTGMTILVHGYSSTVFQSIIECKNVGININVLITECAPEYSGNRMKKALTENDVKSTVILDLSVGFYMKEIDCVVVGSNALCENGGLINRIGTFTLALCAKSFKKPFYVLSECLKFLKLYPLEQSDIPFNNRLINEEKETTSNDLLKGEEKSEDVICDYTPPEFINLLFTDIGIFTPSALSDELIQIFYN
jgi:translation initiation factor eIF-2B subunit alpha